jgi:hypothetical protein
VSDGPRTSLDEQADEIGRELRQRERQYPDAIARGRLKPETAERKIAAFRDAERSMRFFARHADGFRALAHFLIAAGGAMPDPTERQALAAHPGVAALLDQWPDAELTVLPSRPIPAPPADTPADEREDA